MWKMTRYSIGPRAGIFIKRYGFLYFLKKYGENIGKILSEN